MNKKYYRTYDETRSPIFHRIHDCDLRQTAEEFLIGESEKFDKMRKLERIFVGIFHPERVHGHKISKDKWFVKQYKNACLLIKTIMYHVHYKYFCTFTSTTFASIFPLSDVFFLNRWKKSGNGCFMLKVLKCNLQQQKPCNCSDRNISGASWLEDALYSHMQKHKINKKNNFKTESTNFEC